MKRKSWGLGFIQPFGALGYLMPCLEPMASLPGSGIPLPALLQGNLKEKKETNFNLMTKAESWDRAYCRASTFRLLFFSDSSIIFLRYWHEVSRQGLCYDWPPAKLSGIVSIQHKVESATQTRFQDLQRLILFHHMYLQRSLVLDIQCWMVSPYSYL